jgi:hypothetical protein
MTTEELRAAAERLRMYHDAIERNRNFGAFPAPMIKAREVSKAEEFLARAYLAEHSADDGEPITADWLRSVGFTSGNGYLQKENWKNRIDYLESIGRLFINGRGIEWQGETGTRGDVCRLCRALGIELSR